MEDYFDKGSKKILEELNYAPKQIEFAGKIYSLGENSKLVKSIETKLASVSLENIGPILEMNNTRDISIWVKLNGDLKKGRNYKEVENILKHYLEEVDIPPEDLFCWTGNYSYGIERESCSADFQF